MKNLFEILSDENPLDRIVSDGGYCSVFRKIAVVGDSLSSGEFEHVDDEGKKSYHDMFEYSWGQYLARMAGCTVYNFSRGGMTASEYCNSFATDKGFWSQDLASQAYIVALGVNDLFGQSQKLGSVDDVNIADCEQNKNTFAGHYGKLIQRYLAIQPKAKFFFVTMPREESDDEKKIQLKKEHTKLLYDFAEIFPHSYVIDLHQYAPVYDEAFKKSFYMYGHLNPAGYLFTAKIIASYVDFIVRSNFKDFEQVGFIGTPLYDEKRERGEK